MITQTETDLTETPSGVSLDELLGRIIDSQPVHASWHNSASLLHDRRSHRVVLKAPLTTAGLERSEDDGSFRIISDWSDAVGRDVSIDGISFRHSEAIPHRYVAVQMEAAGINEILVAKLSWCRYSQNGDYVSGGRLLREAAIRD